MRNIIAALEQIKLGRVLFVDCTRLPFGLFKIITHMKHKAYLKFPLCPSFSLLNYSTVRCRYDGSLSLNISESVLPKNKNFSYIQTYTDTYQYIYIHTNACCRWGTCVNVLEGFYSVLNIKSDNLI